MEKTYVCQLSAMSIIVKVNGNVRRLEFEPAIVDEYSLRGCAYKTDDKDVQKAIENHPQFLSQYRNRIWIKGGKVEEKVVEPVAEPVAEIVEKPKRVKRIKKEE